MVEQISKLSVQVIEKNILDKLLKVKNNFDGIKKD